MYDLIIVPAVNFQGLNGAVAQLGERRLCKPEVVGSNPSGSTKSSFRCKLTPKRPTPLDREIQISAGGKPAECITFYDIVKKGFA